MYIEASNQFRLNIHHYPGGLRLDVTTKDSPTVPLMGEKLEGDTTLEEAAFRLMQNFHDFRARGSFGRFDGAWA